ncbi:MAG: carbonic anhydrase [Lachnospiraceae bacterium]|nr:carbonic anhydrase [Lachnospiraceae bacterium]
MTVEEIIEKLKKGNERYIHTTNTIGDISERVRLDTAKNGQHPFAVVVACSDSREIPEAIFSCGIGELFVVRVAGNVTDDAVLGSIEYAAEHLHCPLVIVLGHTQCGAVAASMAGGAEGYTKSITDKIMRAIGAEKDARRASLLNVNSTVSCIRAAFAGNEELESVAIMGAMYDVESGEVEFDLT